MIDIFIINWYKILIILIWAVFLTGFYWIEIDNAFPVTAFKVESYKIIRINKYRYNIVLKDTICTSYTTQLRQDNYFSDSLTYNIPSDYLILNKGCTRLYSSLPIPEGMFPDTYVFNMRLTAKINPFKKEERSYPLMKVTVSKDSDILVDINKQVKGVVDNKINYTEIGPLKR
jgi:hypothetical protein